MMTSVWVCLVPSLFPGSIKKGSRGNGSPGLLVIHLCTWLSKSGCQVAFPVLEALQASAQLWQSWVAMGCRVFQVLRPPILNSGLDNTALTERVGRQTGAPPGLMAPNWRVGGSHGQERLLHLILNQENLLMITPCRKHKQWPWRKSGYQG